MPSFGFNGLGVARLVHIKGRTPRRVALRRKDMKKKILALALFAGSGLFAQSRFSVGIQIGYPAPPPVVVYSAPPRPMYTYVTPRPGPGYSWVDGYWYPVGRRYEWRAGYWARPAFSGARWVSP